MTIDEFNETYEIEVNVSAKQSVYLTENKEQRLTYGEPEIIKTIKYTITNRKTNKEVHIAYTENEEHLTDYIREKFNIVDE